MSKVRCSIPFFFIYIMYNNIFKKVVSNAETTTNKINYDIERIAKNNVLNSSVIIRLLDNLEMDDPLSSLIKETLNEVIDKYKIT